MCNVGQSSNHRSRGRKNEISADHEFHYQNIPFDLTKKMKTNTLCFCPQIRKLQVLEILKWAKESQRTKQYNLYFHCSENTSFYIFRALRYSFFLNMHYIYSIFSCILLLFI